MTVREYIGARYVPLFMGEWNSANAYEPLSIVLHEGATYTSRQAVPIGIAITNETYWVLSGNYNAQVEAYRREVQTFDDRITENADDIDTLENNLTNSIQQLNDNLTSEAGARQQGDNNLADSIGNLNSDVSNLSDDLQDEITNRQNADSDIYEAIDLAKQDVIQNYHKTSYNNTLFTFVDSVNGNNDTAELYNENKPFRTLEAAYEAMNDIGNDLRFKFISDGVYYLPVRMLVGAVLHLFAASNTTNVTVKIKNDYGNFFAYDSHINLRSDNTSSKINFVVGEEGQETSRQFEIEGSTLWTNRATITCDRLYLIQGSASITNTVFESKQTANSDSQDSFLDFWFSMVRFYNVTINNRNDAHALHIMVGKLRVENQPFHIGSNANVTNDKSAVYIQDGTIRLNNDFEIGNNSTYGPALQANSSIIFGSDTYYNNWASQTQSGNSVSDGTIRSKLANVIPV